MSIIRRLAICFIHLARDKRMVQIGNGEWVYGTLPLWQACDSKAFAQTLIHKRKVLSSFRISKRVSTANGLCWWVAEPLCGAGYYYHQAYGVRLPCAVNWLRGHGIPRRTRRSKLKSVIVKGQLQARAITDLCGGSGFRRKWNSRITECKCLRCPDSDHFIHNER